MERPSPFIELRSKPQGWRVRSMEEISEAALAYYENGSEEQKQLARDFFNSLDEDGNGTVDVHEFIKILSEEGHGLVNNSGFFQELDRDGNESLDFNEFLTLFYIIKSRSRPFCAGCGIFLKSLFFSCAKCHESSDETFDLCSACYRGKRFSHQHAAFLDNYTLLAHKRLITLGGKGLPNTSQVMYIIIIIIPCIHLPTFSTTFSQALRWFLDPNIQEEGSEFLFIHNISWF